MGFWIPLAMGVGSYLASKNAADKASRDSGAGALLEKAASNLQLLDTPDAQDLTYKLENLVQQGLITPEQAKTFLQEKTAYSDISTDPALRDAQMSALSSLQDIGESGGLTATDRARIEEVMSRVNQEERGAREALTQKFSEQGRGGTMSELVAKMVSGQGAATRASQQGVDIAALAEQRALEALMQAGQLGGNIRSQDFGEQAEIAKAKDALEQFNISHLRENEEANVARREAANAANLTETQRIADQNAMITGENRRIKSEATQTAYQNELDKRKAIANALAAQAQEKTERQKQAASLTGNTLGAIGTIGAGLLSKSDEDAKDISPVPPDMDKFMETLRPIAFKYKNPNSRGAAPGSNVGVTAQDVEKSKVGKTMVKNTSDGKMLDMQKGFGVFLAALASLHDKIEDLEARAAATEGGKA